MPRRPSRDECGGREARGNYRSEIGSPSSAEEGATGWWSGPSTQANPLFAPSLTKEESYRLAGSWDLGSVESHVIPAKAGIQFVLMMWTPAYAGVTP
jgi:hypothetical protein